MSALRPRSVSMLLAFVTLLAPNALATVTVVITNPSSGSTFPVLSEIGAGGKYGWGLGDASPAQVRVRMKNFYGITAIYFIASEMGSDGPFS